MTRVVVKLGGGGALDPMPMLRQAAKDRIDEAFNAEATRWAHLEAAHAQKRLWAQTKDPQLKAEADLRGKTVDALAAEILAKPDELAERELKRVAIKLRIDAAKTPKELDAITP
jgi:hypothetical protein